MAINLRTQAIDSSKSNTVNEINPGQTPETPPSTALPGSPTMNSASLGSTDAVDNTTSAATTLAGATGAGNVEPGATVRQAKLAAPSEIAKAATQYDLATALAAARAHFGKEALQLAKKLAGAVDPSTGLIAMNVQAQDGKLVAKDSTNSALDAARATRGLSELALALVGSDRRTAKELYTAAAANWAATREHLRTADGLPIHLQTFGEGTHVGENTTNMRVNAGGLYPASDSATMLMLAERLGVDGSQYRAALLGETARFIENFYSPTAKTFTYHADAVTGSQAESDSKNGITTDYPLGVVGNDGAVYGLAALLIPTLRALGPDADRIDTSGKAQGKRFSAIVKDQLDLISERLTFKNGALWETYAVGEGGALSPIRFSWQDQPVVPPVTLADGTTLTQSHVAIGGHTVMCAGQLAEGAAELRRLGVIDDVALGRYLDRAVTILQDAVNHGVIDWASGVVQNANMLEVPDGYPDSRKKPGGNDWGQAGWQQRELLQTLLVLRDAGRLDSLKGQNGGTGADLLRASIQATAEGFAVPKDYAGGFGDEWRYHALQAAAYFAEHVQA
jgi:hypothetical protein